VAWWQELDQDTLSRIVELKREKHLFKPLAKLLIILYYGVPANWSSMLRELLGGNYTNVVKEGVLAGYVMYEKGRPPTLTPRGRAVAAALAEAWQKIREGEREGENWDGK